jgi:Tfp pilus assembly protein PilF
VNPRYVQARIQLGVLLLSAGEAPGAVDEFRGVLEIEPDNKAAQMYLRIAQSPSRSQPPRAG